MSTPERRWTRSSPKPLEAAGGIGRDDIDCVVGTGAGREDASFADDQVTEVAAAARGACSIFPSARTVIDVGAEEGRAVRCNERGKVVDFAVNEKCAAGAGAFTEAMARALEVELEELGPLSLQLHPGDPDERPVRGVRRERGGLADPRQDAQGGHRAGGPRRHRQPHHLHGAQGRLREGRCAGRRPGQERGLRRLAERGAWRPRSWCPKSPSTSARSARRSWPPTGSPRGGDGSMARRVLALEGVQLARSRSTRREAEVISAGVDVGSVSSQAVVMVDGKLYAFSNMRTGSDSPESARKAMDWALEDTGLPLGRHPLRRRHRLRPGQRALRPQGHHRDRLPRPRRQLHVRSHRCAPCSTWAARTARRSAATRRAR